MSIQKAGKTILSRIRPYKPVDTKRVIYETTQDIFERRDTVLDVAKDFRKRLVNPIADWKTGLPAYGDEGYGTLRQIISSYTNYVEKLKPQDAEKFTKLATKANDDQSVIIHKLTESTKDYSRQIEINENETTEVQYE